jgi:hypothetical protein
LVAALAYPRVGAAAMTPREPAAVIRRGPAAVIRRGPVAVLRERTTLLATQPLARPAPPIASWRRSCALALHQLAEVAEVAELKQSAPPQSWATVQ